jgi:hypothetical protein
MDAPTPLAAFCVQLIAFFEDLYETYPEEGDIKKALRAVRLAKKTNPRLLHKHFMEQIYPLAPQILDEDEEYLIATARQMSDTQSALWVFDRVWPTMTETNKQHVWRHIKMLVVLAGRVV